MKEMKLDNPFVVTGYFGPEYFCDRESETEELVSAMKNGWNVTLISPRRLGKTGLIKHAFNRLEDSSGVKCFYVDIYSTKNLSDLVQALAHAIVGKLDSPLEKAVKKVNSVFAAFRPTMTLDTHTGQPTFSFDITPQQAQMSLESIFKYLGSYNKKCVVAIDEFQQVAEYPEGGTEGLIRSYVQFMPHARFVFAGSRQHMMEEMFLSATHPFYRSTHIMNLREINENKYRDFANRFFGEQGREIAECDFHHLYAAVDGQTFFVQAILNKIYSHPRQKIDRDFILQCTSEAVDEQVAAFQYIYSSLTENQAVLLHAIACEHTVKEPLGGEFSQRYRLPAKSSLRLALDYLVRNQLVYRDMQRGYVVYDKFMGMWLASL